MTSVSTASALATLVWIYALAAAVQPSYASDSTVTSTITQTSTVATTTTTVTPGPATSVPNAPTATANMPESGSGIYSGSQFRDAVLNSTNIYRQAYKADPLTWDDTLASYAQDYAERCVWEHSGGDYGENLALNFATPTLAIDSWASEEKRYDYSKAKFGEQTGHFTQLVWQATQRVGCGAANCDNGDVQGWLLVCEYDPPGNVVGAFKENVEKAGDAAGELGVDAASGLRLGGVSGALLVAMVGASALVGLYL